MKLLDFLKYNLDFWKRNCYICANAVKFWSSKLAAQVGLEIDAVKMQIFLQSTLWIPQFYICAISTILWNSTLERRDKGGFGSNKGLDARWPFLKFVFPFLLSSKNCGLFSFWLALYSAWYLQCLLSNNMLVAFLYQISHILVKKWQLALFTGCQRNRASQQIIFMSSQIQWAVFAAFILIYMYLV